jgi:hypothetical protein
MTPKMRLVSWYLEVSASTISSCWPQGVAANESAAFWVTRVAAIIGASFIARILKDIFSLLYGAADFTAR